MLQNSKNAEMTAIAVSPKKGAAMLDLGLTRFYELMNAGEIESYRDGKSRKILIASLRSYVNRRLVAEKSLKKASWTDRATQARAKNKNNHS